MDIFHTKVVLDNASVQLALGTMRKIFSTLFKLVLVLAVTFLKMELLSSKNHSKSFQNLGGPLLKENSILLFTVR